MSYSYDNPLFVTEAFVSAVVKLHPDAIDPLVRRVVFYDSGDGKGPRLVKWDLDAPIPTDEEVRETLLPLVETTL